MEDGHLAYSILMPRYDQEVHLEPETAEKVIDALRVLLEDRRMEEAINEGCRKIPIFSKVKNVN